MNPRLLSGEPLFESGALSHSATSPIIITKFVVRSYEFGENDTQSQFIIYTWRHNFSWFVIPGLTRNPVFSWIPAGVYPVLCYGAGMTGFVVINDAVYSSLNPELLTPNSELLLNFISVP